MAKRSGASGSAAFANILAAVRAARAHGWYTPPNDHGVFMLAAEHERLDAARAEFFAHDAKSLEVFDWAVRRRVAGCFAPNPAMRLPFDLGGDPFTRERWAELERRAEALPRHAVGDELEDRLCCWILESCRLPGICEAAPGDVVLDCGAFTGNTAMYFAEKAGPEGRVFAFEPSPQNHVLLVKNTKKLPNVITDDRAVAEYPGVTKIAAGGGAGAYIAERGDDVRAVSLDVFAAERRLERVDFIKMDIEGFEVDALRGAAGLIRRFSPKMALSAYHRPLDLADLPMVVANINPGYKFYLRHFTDKQWETVLYCAPGQAEKRRLFAAKPKPAAALSDGDLAELISKLGAIGGAAFSPPQRAAAQAPTEEAGEDCLSPEPEGEPPFLSVVIPAYNAAGTLPKTLNSMKAALTNIPHEVIVVDDRSPDGLSDVVLRHAKRYGQLRLLSLARNGGAGNARERGAAIARGEWLWFFDADDYVPDGAFKGFDYQAACDGQDALVFTYMRRLHRDAANLPIVRYDQAILDARPADTFSVSEYPEIIGLSVAVWHKWFRAAAAKRAGARFADIAPGEEWPYVLPCLLEARSIRVAERAVAVYCEYRSNLSKLKDARLLESFGVLLGCERLVRAKNDRRLTLMFLASRANYLTWVAQSIVGSLSAGVREYLDDTLDALNEEEVMRLLAAPFLNPGARVRLAARKGIDIRQATRMAAVMAKIDK